MTPTNQQHAKEVKFVIESGLLNDEKYSNLITFKDLQDYFTLQDESKHLDCPLCNAPISFKRYKRRITTQLTDFLISLCQLMSTTGEKFHHYQTIKDHQKLTFGTSSTDYIVLKIHGLIAYDVKGSGKFTLTNKALSWLKGEIVIPEYLIMLHNQIIGISEKTVSVYEVRPNIKSLYKNY